MFLLSPFFLRDTHYVFFPDGEKFNFHVHTKHALKLYVYVLTLNFWNAQLCWFLSSFTDQSGKN